jgi:hypothetical protein
MDQRAVIQIVFYVAKGFVARGLGDYAPIGALTNSGPQFQSVERREKYRLTIARSITQRRSSMVVWDV